MSSKSKTTMEAIAVEGNSNGSGRPVRRAAKPVSYNEQPERKRGKESSSDPSDQRKKKVNGSSNDAPPKKAGKKKVETENGKSSEKGEAEENEPMPDNSRKRKNDPTPVAEETGNKTKKPQARSKREKNVADIAVEDSPVDADDKPAPEPKAQKELKTRKKAKEVIEETNTVEEGTGSSKAYDADDNPISEPKAQKELKTRKKAKEAIEETNVDEGQGSSKANEPKAGVATKAPRKKPTKQAPTSEDDTQDKSDNEEEITATVAISKAASKAPKGGMKVSKKPTAANDDVVAAPKAGKGKKASKEPSASSNAVEDVQIAKDEKKKPGRQPKKGKESENATKGISRGSKRKANEALVGQSAQPKTSRKEPKKEKSLEELPESRTKPKISKNVQIRKKHLTPVPSSSVKLETIKEVPPTSQIPNHLNASPAESDFEVPAKEFNFKISSWNVAGLRAIAKKDGLKYIIKEDPNILCLQETKCLEEDVPEEFKIDGYHKYWLGMKGGHAGVALYSKVMPYSITYGINDPEMDKEARLITAEYTKFFVLCVYVPNAGRGLVNLEKRLAWNRMFLDKINELKKRKPVIICGDMNVAHNEIDIANPKSNAKSAGFTKEERNDMTNMLSEGFVDTYRLLYPDKTKAYTYWTYMNNARAKNIGWRLDYFIVSEKLTEKVVENLIRSQVTGSDHCPITLFLNI